MWQAARKCPLGRHKRVRKYDRERLPDRNTPLLFGIPFLLACSSRSVPANKVCTLRNLWCRSSLVSLRLPLTVWFSTYSKHHEQFRFVKRQGLLACDCIARSRSHFPFPH